MSRLAPILPPPPDAARALLLATLAVFQDGQGHDLYSALRAATLRTNAPPAVAHCAQAELLAAKDERGQYRFSLHDEVHRAPALATWLGVSDTERAPAPPAARDTDVTPFVAEMAVTCGDEVAA